ITSLQIMNLTSREDKYDPIFIYVHQQTLLVSVNLLKEKNEFLIDAFVDNDRVDTSHFSTLGSATNKVKINILEDRTGRITPPQQAAPIPRTAGAAVTPVALGSPTKDVTPVVASPAARENAIVAPTPSVKLADPTPKIRLQAPTDVSYTNSVSI